MTAPMPGYSFACPECKAPWELTSGFGIAASIFGGSYKGRAKCPSCGEEFFWTGDGEMQTAGGVIDLSRYLLRDNRRPKVAKVCTCGCGEQFSTTFPRQKYKNDTHRKRAWARKNRN